MIHGRIFDAPEWSRHHLDLCGPEALALIPVEFAIIRLRDRHPASEVLDALAAWAAPSAEEWFDFLGAIAGSGDLHALSRATGERAAQAEGWTDAQRGTFAQFRESGERAHAKPAEATADAAFGVLGYRHPDNRKGSQNIGDYVQTISALGTSCADPASASPASRSWSRLQRTPAAGSGRIWSSTATMRPSSWSK